LSIRISIVGFPAFGALRSMKIRISAMIKSTKECQKRPSPEASNRRTGGFPQYRLGQMQVFKAGGALMGLIDGFGQAYSRDNYLLP
jgi:hypothetical protein